MEGAKTFSQGGQEEIEAHLLRNAIRPACASKANCLFIGHPDAGRSSALIYSLRITARRCRLESIACLIELLRRMPTLTWANLPEFLPKTWKSKATWLLDKPDSK
jgi:hypothetical protein